MPLLRLLHFGFLLLVSFAKLRETHTQKNSQIAGQVLRSSLDHCGLSWAGGVRAARVSGGIRHDMRRIFLEGSWCVLYNILTFHFLHHFSSSQSTCEFTSHISSLKPRRFPSSCLLHTLSCCGQQLNRHGLVVLWRLRCHLL